MLGFIRRHRIRRKLRIIFDLSKDIGSWNEDVVKRKLRLYKSLAKNYNQEDLSSTAKLIETQLSQYMQIRTTFDYVSYGNSKLKGDMQNLVYIYEQSRVLLNEFIEILNAQLQILKSDYSIKDKVHYYKRSFKQELTVYKQYDGLCRSLGPERVQNANRELIAFLIDRNMLDDYAAQLLATASTFLLLLLLGRLDNEQTEAIINQMENFLKNQDLNILLVANSLNVLINRLYHGVQKLHYLKQYNRKFLAESSQPF